MNFEQPKKPSETEVHTRRELYDKLVARRDALPREDYPHFFPDADGHYDTFRGDYKPTEDQAVVDERIADCKRKKKSILLADWYKFGVHATFRDSREEWLKFINEVDRRHINNLSYNGIASLDRFDYRDVSYEWFVQNYEKPNKPCMISGFSEGWPMNKWTLKTLSENFMKDERVKVGKDNSGYPVRIETKNYVQYCATNKDDSPVYLFESQLAANPNIAQIFDNYSRPAWFTNDLFDLVPQTRRPPYRWFCLGPERSGTTMHYDPLFTNAWNTVIAGRKVWILFPPEVPDDIAMGYRFMDKENRPHPNIESEAIGWWTRVFLAKMVPWLMEEGRNLGAIVCIQHPGETIFVPGNWRHYVLNLDDSMAVTQNYCNRSNVQAVWRDLRKERKHLARRFALAIEQKVPEISRIIEHINKKDNFQYRFSELSAERKEQRRKRILARQNKTEEVSDHESDDEPSGEWDSSTNESSHYESSDAEEEEA